MKKQNRKALQREEVVTLSETYDPAHSFIYDKAHTKTSDLLSLEKTELSKPKSRQEAISVQA